MSKLREPVIYSFDHTSFVVDIDKQVLRQTDKPENEISFIRDLTDFGDHYLLAWNENTKQVTTDPDEAAAYIIPQLVQLDPQGMSEKYSIPVEKLQSMSDFEVIVDRTALASRKQNILPQIDIAGENFVVNLRMHELRHAQHFFPVISLKSFELTNDGWNYEAFYEPLMKQVVEIDPKLLEFPPGVIKIKLPNEIGLDPVGAAQIYGMDEREVLRRYPIQKELKAEVIPLAETEIPRLIRQNKEQLQRDHQENMQKIGPRNRHRF
ncbi:hypothetical protein FHW88_005639 [Mucilaginibacter sp. SG538B]|uniref:hypothetical protein n=1 Tax=Mucilaginibacter sp. SG538B TaxID=2587021 RepID=UPI00159E1F85|nr:hypothetical protein [Mucilaginibacter sp. SG538B]NVM67318.1 hypothetical protein [Mucilaginibacter sp. SG538B]